ncbi:HD domain-containing protein [Desulfosarcina sp. OttesenSCG-928-A07]|nr:HD domain-containing protein [Desulfosarcina sp. OttesenSCG-928-G17]MDL2328693.1 HD domain-containing protein [Desulfosarcina sp. OttesenSCG-928-A07]
MAPIYLKLRKIARDLVASHATPDFYRDYAAEADDARRFYHTDPVVVQVREMALPLLQNNFGHGMGHGEAVAIDAGTLTIIESRKHGHTGDKVWRHLLLAQCAGLLHDICRKEKNHAEKGAETTRRIISSFSFQDTEVDAICLAIRNHEAFTRLTPPATDLERLISDCLYDADKFRWGPDNFSHTLWDMTELASPSITTFAHHYPQGMVVLEKIRETFRSCTGQQYGPQFINIGLAIGADLYRIIQADFLN